nr:HAD-IB family hydrolase [Streptoalloteichus tenebrarius]
MTDVSSGPASSADRRVAAFFDLDRTVIAKSSTLAFSRPFFQEGLINRRAVLKSAYAQFVFMLAGADEDQTDRMRAHITALCAGWDVEQVRAIVEETLHDVVDPLVYKEAAQLVAEHRERGHDVVVVSSSGEEVVGPIAQMVGATDSVGTRMVVESGRYTGEVDFYCSGEGKAEVVRKLAAERGYDLADCHAYSDSIADLPLLEAVGHPTAVNPDRGLRKVAVQRGWPVLAFSHPVSLRARIPTPSGTAVAAAAAAVGLGAVAAAGVAWYGLRRRRRCED